MNDKTLAIIIGLPTTGIGHIEGCEPSTAFTELATKKGEPKKARVPKMKLKGEYQLTFEYVNKIKVPRSEKRIVASAADHFVMENFSDPEEINLPAIIL